VAIYQRKLKFPELELTSQYLNCFDP
jgi:hypothetical protein